MGINFVVNYPPPKGGGLYPSNPQEGSPDTSPLTETFISSADKSAFDLHKHSTTFLVLRKARFRLATEYQYIKELYINSSKT